MCVAEGDPNHAHMSVHSKHTRTAAITATSAFVETIAFGRRRLNGDVATLDVVLRLVEHLCVHASE